MKLSAKLLLLLIIALNLGGCVLILNNNFGSDIHTNKTMDDLGLAQEYTADVKNKTRDKLTR